jgi:hypothetical protein
MIMMLIVEYLNVQSKGAWSEKLKKSPISQLLIAGLLGITPGCLGAYTVVSLYTHNIFSFGALVTVMIATTGDEAFVMFSMIPEETIKITAIIFGIAILSGFIINLFKVPKTKLSHQTFHFKIHKEENDCHGRKRFNIFKEFKNISFHRAIIIFGLFIFLFALSSGKIGHIHNEEPQAEIVHHDHDHEIDDIEEHHHELHGDNELFTHWNWISITFLVLSLCALFIAATVPDHFLESHLWEHIIKKHFIKIFLWTFGALVFINILINYLDIDIWLKDNQLIILLVAVLIGLIPESGPHLVFVTLFFEGTIPFSTLLASSIVQDGHGALPLFAESKKSFVLVKLINLLVGLGAGIIGLYIL